MFPSVLDMSLDVLVPKLFDERIVKVYVSIEVA